MKNQTYTNIAGSSVKVVASEELELSLDKDLNEEQETKSIEELLNEQKKAAETT
jgi:hypothetical protein